MASPLVPDIPVRPSKSEIPPRQPLIKLSMNQENALVNWQRKMAERKRQQGYISSMYVCNGLVKLFQDVTVTRRYIAECSGTSVAKR